MSIILVRHAQVQNEYIGKYNGHKDISLSKHGKAQAKELGEKLKGVTFDKIYCSDLKRARETLEAFNCEVKPIFTKELREKSWGIHEGKSFEEIEKSGIKYENFEQWIHALDGESIEEFRNKVEHFFYEIIFKQEEKYENILVLTHSGVIKTFLSIYRQISLEKAFAVQLNYADYIKL